MQIMNVQKIHFPFGNYFTLFLEEKNIDIICKNLIAIFSAKTIHDAEEDFVLSNFTESYKSISIIYLDSVYISKTQHGVVRFKIKFGKLQNFIVILAIVFSMLILLSAWNNTLSDFISLIIAFIFFPIFGYLNKAIPAWLLTRKLNGKKIKSIY